MEKKRKIRVRLPEESRTQPEEKKTSAWVKREDGVEDKKQYSDPKKNAK